MNEKGATLPAGPGNDDLRNLVASLWRYKWFIAAVTAVGALIFGIVGLLTQPVYRATTVLIPTFNERGGLSGALDGAAGQLGGLASLVGINVNSQDSSTEEALAVLHSRRFIEHFINDGGLLRVLFAKNWDANSNAWRPGMAPTMAMASKKFSDHVAHAEQDNKTSLVTLYIDWADRNLAAKWANDIVARLNEEMRSRAIDHATASLDYLHKELDSTTAVEIRQAINNLIQAQIKQRMLATVSPEYAFRVIDPASVPDQADWVRPKRATLVVIGIILGFTLGFAAVFLKVSLRGGPR